VTTPPKNTVTLVLKKAGAIEYYCRFHPDMKAILHRCAVKGSRNVGNAP
jgi:plastocyanin